MSRGPVETRPLKPHPKWKGASAFAIIAGVAILGLGAYLLATGYFAADFATAYWSTWGRLAGEVATALMLLFAASALLSGRSWARNAYLVAMGMLVFASFQGLGHYGQRGNLGLVGLFFLLGAFAVFYAIRAEE